MKTQLLALGILATSMGFAADNGQMKSTQNQSNCCSSCCCTPCCCTSPTPDKSVTGMAFTAPWYNMSCDCGFFLTVDFLYWYGREDNLSYAMKGESVRIGEVENYPDPIIVQDLFLMNKLMYLNAKWDPGVRVGLGWNTDCDGWDTYLYWTYYKNKKKGKTSVSDFGEGDYPGAGSFGLINPWGILGTSEDQLVWTNVSAKWDFTFNSLDLELGKRYWLSKCFTMRPFASLRWIWTSTDFDLSSVRNGLSSNPGFPSAGSTLDTTAGIDFDNKYWGAGLVGGFQPTWYFTPCFSIYANADIALLWGDHSMKRKDSYVQTSVVVQTGLPGDGVDLNYSSSKSDFAMMQPMMDLALGIRWENYYCSNQYHFEVDLGWEHHQLFNHNYRFQYKGNDHTASSVSPTEEIFAFSSYSETMHNVAFGGLVLRVRFDF